MYINKNSFIPDYSTQLLNPLAQQNFCVFEINNDDFKAAKKILNLRFFDPANIFKNSEFILGKPEKWYVLGNNIIGVNSWSQVSVSDQYYALNNTATIFPATTMQFVKVQGEGAGALLDIASPRIISDLKINSCRFTFFTNPSGTIDDEAVIIRTAPNEFIMSCGSGRIPSGLLKLPNAQIPPVSVEEVDLSILIIFGPQKLEVLNSLIIEEHRDDIIKLKEFDSCLVNLVIAGSVRIVRTLIGYEIWADSSTIELLWKYALTEKLIVPCGWDALNIFRLECNKFVFKLYPMDMSAGTTLWEIDGGWLIKKSDERDFIGKKSLLDLENKKRFWFGGLKSIQEGEHIKNIIPSIGDPIFYKNQKFTGYVTSSCFSPRENRALIFAHLMNNVSIGEVVTISGEEYVISNLPF